MIPPVEPEPASSRRSVRPWHEPAEPPPANFVQQAVMTTAAQVEKKRRQRAEQPTGKALVGWARRALGNTIPSDRARERRRGPVTAAFAERELEDAHASDEALAVFFAYAKQYFEYSALFVVHGDLAAGNDAWGPGAGRDKVRGIGVALDLPSALSDARDRAAPIIVRLNRAGLDADLRKDLSRAALQPVLVLPIMLRARCVALLYGDAGEEPVRDGDIGDVVAMAPLLARSLERILLRKKRAALRDSGGIKSKLGPSDTSILPEHPVDSFGPAAFCSRREPCLARRTSRRPIGSGRQTRDVGRRRLGRRRVVDSPSTTIRVNKRRRVRFRYRRGPLT